MRGQKNVVGKIYPKYQPYPLSFDSKEKTYSRDTAESFETRSTNRSSVGPVEDFRDLIGEPTPPDWLATKPLSSNDARPLRPLRLLQSLFADRLSFLQRALDELESSKKERQHLMQYALEELDPEIQDCELSLSTLKSGLNDPENRKHLERRLSDLKRERRREALLSWRDLVWLKGEIRKLQREIDALGSTAASAENREAPT